jgi:hypothetical protein
MEKTGLAAVPSSSWKSLWMKAVIHSFENAVLFKQSVLKVGKSENSNQFLISANQHDKMRWAE